MSDYLHSLSDNYISRDDKVQLPVTAGQLQASLSELKLRDVEISSYMLGEDDQCKLHLLRTGNQGEVKKHHLYIVILTDGTTHYCLAEDEAGAIGQSACARDRSYEQQKALELGAKAMSLPLRMRGWGSQTV